MKLRIFIAIVVAIAVIAIVLGYASSTTDANEVGSFYGASLRGSLFSGFLGLGGFLLSLKTFIVVKMKEGLYDNKMYRKNHAESTRAGNTAKLFAPLGNLRELLFLSIVSSLMTAVLQITVGLFTHPVTVAIALGAGGFTVALLAQSLIEINANLRSWFKLLQTEADEVEAEAKKAQESIPTPPEVPTLSTSS